MSEDAARVIDAEADAGAVIAPIARDDRFAIVEDRASMLDVLSNNERGNNAISIVEAPAHGRARVVANAIEYTPDARYGGDDVLRLVTLRIRSFGDAQRIAVT